MASRTPSRSLSSASLPADDTSSSTSVPAAEPFAAEKEAKLASLLVACQNADLHALIELAASAHGLVNDTVRRTAWPILLGCGTQSSDGREGWKALPEHRDENQVALDVNRAFVYYPIESEKQLDRRKEHLSDVIVEVLRRYPALCYFQGYHDIVQVFLLVLGAQDAPPAVARLSLLRIRDFMLPSLDPAISHLELLPPIIQSADPVLFNHLPQAKPFFALASTLTLFAHVIQAYGDIARLFDFFLATDTVMPVYFFAAVLLSRREELLEIEKEDVDIFHATLGKLPQHLDLERLVDQSRALYSRFPPPYLRGWAWWRISSSSVLKASRTPADIASTRLETGLELLRKQETELQRKLAFDKALKRTTYIKTQLWYYRRSGTYGLAIAAGLYALWLGRNGGTGSRFLANGPVGDLLRRLAGTFA
ncbi:rab-GTPase-TBC domain-containing protein [Lophiotrema nucula]|uniref:Rab-GTPase-TBC domain-containing protein n=1 Tax=Lophiotrema nucula TaxID=690887 RepID=A0A6A5ZT22_9PLEO|nr:rab-GTPase-TBC domain-containing protein [Lophiotrema nucula]